MAANEMGCPTEGCVYVLDDDDDDDACVTTHTPTSPLLPPSHTHNDRYRSHYHSPPPITTTTHLTLQPTTVHCSKKSVRLTERLHNL